MLVPHLGAISAVFSRIQQYTFACLYRGQNGYLQTTKYIFNFTLIKVTLRK